MRKHPLQNIFEDFFEARNPLDQCCKEELCTKSHSEGLSISEDDQHFYIEAPLPGIPSDEVEVTLDPKKRQLEIKGEKKLEKENVKYHLKGSRDYYYCIPLANDIDYEKIDAVSKDGILSITLTKNKSNQPLKIDVRVA